MKNIAFLLLLLLNYSWSTAQITNNYHNFNINEGLPSSQVYSITEDNYGYLWLFTDNGLSRYDGYHFENFNKSDGLCDAVNFNYYKNNDEIWVIGLDKVITIISGKIPNFRAYEFNDTIKKYGKFNPKELIVDKNQNIVIHFEYSLGSLIIDKYGSVIEVPIYKTENTFTNTVYLSFYENSFTQITQNPNENYSSASFKFHTYYTKTKGALLNEKNFAFLKGDSTIEIHNGNNLYSIHQPNDALNIGTLDQSTYWISYIGKGIKYFNTKGTEISHLFNNYTVTSLYIDKEKNKWFSTLNNGVFMLPLNQFNIIEKLSKSNNISDIEISNNELFIGLKTGSVYKLKKRKLKKVYIGSENKPIIFASNKKTKSVIFIADRTLFEYNKTVKPLIKKIGYPYQMKYIDNSLLGFSGSFGYSTFKNNLEDEKINIRKIYDFLNYQNHLYLGAYSGLYKIDNDQKINLLNKRITRLAIFNDYLFAGTNGDGLYIFNDTNFIDKIDSKKLNGGYITCLKQQNQNSIWVGTNTGLSKIEFSDNLNITNYSIINYNNYIPEKEITDVEILNDTLWIATNNGLYFHALSNNLIEGNNNRYNIQYGLNIDQIKINDELTKLTDLNNLSYDENRLTIHYKAISFKQNHDILYRYKLIGLESKWNYSQKQIVTYASIPSGKYKFIVQVKEENENWKNQQNSFLITIKSPFWLTEWFITTVICLLFMLIYLFFKYRILLYNKDILRELLRHFLKAIQRNEKSIIIKVSGSNIKIMTNDILYVKSDGNYLEIHTENQKYLTREKISNFLKIVPDPIEFIQIRRSHIIRIDKITEKGKKHIIVNNVKIKIGETYLEKFKLINF